MSNPLKDKNFRISTKEGRFIGLWGNHLFEEVENGYIKLRNS